MFGGLKGQSKWPIAKINKFSFGMHTQLINMQLEEGMIIKGI